MNWVRLRYVSINYRLPNKILERSKIFSSASIGFTATDLFMWTNYTGGDPAVNGNTAAGRGVGAWGFDYGSLPTPISVNIGIRASF